MQNDLYKQFMEYAVELSIDYGDINERDIEFTFCQTEYKTIFEFIQREMEIQANLKTEIDEVRKELNESPYLEEMKTHAMLEE
jgi:hypothetical protein